MHFIIPVIAWFVLVIGNYCVTSPMTIVRRCYLNDPLLPWRIVRGIQSDENGRWQRSPCYLWNKIVIPSSLVLLHFLTILERKRNLDLDKLYSSWLLNNKWNYTFLENFSRNRVSGENIDFDVSSVNLTKWINRGVEKGEKMKILDISKRNFNFGGRDFGILTFDSRKTNFRSFAGQKKRKFATEEVE